MLSYYTKSVIIFSTVLISIMTRPAYSQEQLVFATLPTPVTTKVVEILSSAYKKIGYSVKIKEYPGKRALQMSNSGKVDGEVLRIKLSGEKYPNLIQIPVPVIQIGAMAFSKNTTIDVSNWDNLKPYRIGILMGTKYSDKQTQGFKKSILPTYKQLFTMLNNNRIEIVIASREAGLKAISEMGLLNIKMLTPAVENINFYHYLHKKHKALVPQITQELQKMQSQGLF